MNAGIKKLNSEATPENSLNNLLKDMNKDNNTNLTAINTNLKDTKALNENQLAELKKMTTELKKLNATTGTSTSTITQPITDNFTPAESDNGGLGSNFENDKSIIDSFTGIYTDFKDNLLGHKQTLENLVNNTKDTINNGIGLSLSTLEIINCPLNYNLDMTQTIGKNIAFNIDICEVTSKTKPYLYPIFLIMFTVGSVFFAFKFIGVLL
jgi:phage-related protein